MGSRGRRSENELSVIVDPTGRQPLRAPAELTDAQAAVWRQTVGSMRGDWLARGAAPVLVEYCRRVCRARLAERVIARFEMKWINEGGGLEEFDRLLVIADRESRAVLACARALRLTPQAQQHAKTAARMVDHRPPSPKLWDR